MWMKLKTYGLVRLLSWFWNLKNFTFSSLFSHVRQRRRRSVWHIAIISKSNRTASVHIKKNNTRKYARNSLETKTFILFLYCCFSSFFFFFSFSIERLLKKQFVLIRGISRTFSSPIHSLESLDTWKFHFQTLSEEQTMSVWDDSRCEIDDEDVSYAFSSVKEEEHQLWNRQV